VGEGPFFHKGLKFKEGTFLSTNPKRELAFCGWPRELGWAHFLGFKEGTLPFWGFTGKELIFGGEKNPGKLSTFILGANRKRNWGFVERF